jgi:hypothetical protein
MSAPKVRLVQLLCPARHAIMAMAYQSQDGAEEPEMATRLRAAFEELLRLGANPWCEICRSRDLHTEDSPTPWESIETALPHLKQLEREQAAAREFFRTARN